MSHVGDPSVGPEGAHLFLHGRPETARGPIIGRERTMSTANSNSRPMEEPHIAALRPEELRGHAMGIIVCAVMGFTWGGTALGALSVVVAVPLLAVGAACAAVLLAGARRVRHAAIVSPVPSSPKPDLSQGRHHFNLVVAGEVAAIIVAVGLLGRSDHADWIPATICLVVGLHLIPLARLFRLPLYYATAAALCLVAATTMVFGAAGAPEALWQLLPGVGVALVLWATGAMLLAKSTR